MDHEMRPIVGELSTRIMRSDRSWGRTVPTSVEGAKVMRLVCR